MQSVAVFSFRRCRDPRASRAPSPLLAVLVDRLAPLRVEITDVLDGDPGRLRGARQTELLVLIVGVAGLGADEEEQHGRRLPGEGAIGIPVASLVLPLVADEVVAELEYLDEVVDVRRRLARVLEERQRARLAGPLRAQEARAAAQLHLQPADGVARRALRPLQLV